MLESPARFRRARSSLAERRSRAERRARLRSRRSRSRPPSASSLPCRGRARRSSGLRRSAQARPAPVDAAVVGGAGARRTAVEIVDESQARRYDIACARPAAEIDLVFDRFEERDLSVAQAAAVVEVQSNRQTWSTCRLPPIVCGAVTRNGRIPNRACALGVERPGAAGRVHRCGAPASPCRNCRR